MVSSLTTCGNNTQNVYWNNKTATPNQALLEASLLPALRSYMIFGAIASVFNVICILTFLTKKVIFLFIHALNLCNLCEGKKLVFRCEIKLRHVCVNSKYGLSITDYSHPGCNLDSSLEYATALIDAPKYERMILNSILFILSFSPALYKRNWAPCS
jgi:hypothetical protein